jgi:hypothetical protein
MVVIRIDPFTNALLAAPKKDLDLRSGSPPGEHRPDISGLWDFFLRTGSYPIAFLPLSFPKSLNGRWPRNPVGCHPPHIRSKNKQGQASNNSFLIDVFLVLIARS